MLLLSKPTHKSWLSGQKNAASKCTYSPPSNNSGRRETGAQPVMALWPVHTSSQFLLLWLPRLKPFLFQARLFHWEECRQIRSRSLKLRPCFQGVYLGSEELCLSRLIFRGGAGFLGHMVGQEGFSSTFYCFYQSYYHLLSTQVNAEQVQLVTGLPLDGINETKSKYRYR